MTAALVLLLDKSAFHMMKGREYSLLGRHFLHILPPILPLEVLGDLAKEFKGRTPEDEVQKLARQFGGSGGVSCVSFQDACFNSLLGNEPPMTGQIPVAHGVTTRNPDGTTNLAVTLSEYNKAILRWGERDFRSDEYTASGMFRHTTRSLTREEFDAEVNVHHIILPRVTNVEDLPKAADDVIATPNLQGVWLHWMLRKCRLSPRQQKMVRRRWKERVSLYFKDFARYAHYCLRVQVIHHIAVRHGLARWNSTNLLDLHYLYYLPFCTVFCSNDKLHRKLAPLLLRSDQSFIRADDLKADLAARVRAQECMDAVTSSRYEFALGQYPVPMPGSVISALWEKHMPPWRRGRGNLAIRLSPQEQEEAFREVETLFADYETHATNPSPKSS